MKSKLFKIAILFLALAVSFYAGYRFNDFRRYLKARDEYSGGQEQFDKNFQAMNDWLKKYKQDHPDATDADAQKAYQDLMNYLQKLEDEKNSAN